MKNSDLLLTTRSVVEIFVELELDIFVNLNLKSHVKKRIKVWPPQKLHKNCTKISKIFTRTKFF